MLYGILILVILVSLIATFVFCVAWLLEEDKIDGIISLISLLICIASATLFFVGENKVLNMQWIIEENPYSVECITVLQDNNLTNGHFYARRGYINEDLYYQYMTKRSDGGYVANKVKANNATIYITSSNYRVEWYKESKHWLFFERERDVQKIYLPSNSIKEDYSIDLK